MPAQQPNIPYALRPQFDQAVATVHSLGPRVTAEAFAEVAARIGGLPAIMSVLNEFRRLSPQKLRVTGGDRFPVRPLRRVPL